MFTKVFVSYGMSVPVTTGFTASN